MNSWKCISGSPPCRPVQYVAHLQQWHVGVGPRAESLQRKRWIRTHVWDTSNAGHSWWKWAEDWTTTNHCVSSDSDTRWLVACVGSLSVWRHQIIIICLTNQGKVTRHLLSASTDAQLNTQSTISFINTSLQSPSGSAHTHISCVSRHNECHLAGSFSSPSQIPVSSKWRCRSLISAWAMEAAYVSCQRERGKTMPEKFYI